MATPKLLRPISRPLTRPPPPLFHAPHQQHQRRTFLPNPFSSLNPLTSTANPSPTNPTTSSPQPTYQTLSASRTLPYPPAPIYSIIADVSSYPTFLPYCHSSTATRLSSPDPIYNRRWPSEGTIVVGWATFTESWTSRIFCIPGRVVESVSGKTQTSLRREDIGHHLEGEGDGPPGRKSAAVEGGLLTHLRNRWTVNGVEEEKTQVRLELEFAFAKPLYTTLSAGAAPKVAEAMIKAFEERVRYLLENNPEMARASLEQLEGSRLKAS